MTKLICLRCYVRVFHPDENILLPEQKELRISLIEKARTRCALSCIYLSKSLHSPYNMLYCYQVICKRYQ